MEMYSKEATQAAIRLVALGVAGILPQDQAKEELEKLPEDLAKYVVATTVATYITQREAIKKITKAVVEKGEEPKVSSEVSEMIRKKLGEI